MFSKIVFLFSTATVTDGLVSSFISRWSNRGQRFKSQRGVITTGIKVSLYLLTGMVHIFLCQPIFFFLFLFSARLSRALSLGQIGHCLRCTFCSAIWDGSPRGLSRPGPAVARTSLLSGPHQRQVRARSTSSDFNLPSRVPLNHFLILYSLPFPGTLYLSTHTHLNTQYTAPLHCHHKNSECCANSRKRFQNWAEKECGTWSL